MTSHVGQSRPAYDGVRVPADGGSAAAAKQASDQHDDRAVVERLLEYQLDDFSVLDRGGVKETLREAGIEFVDEGRSIWVPSRDTEQVDRLVGEIADVEPAVIVYDLSALSTRERGGVKEALRDAMVPFDDAGLQIHVSSRNADVAEAVIAAIADVES